MKNSTSKPIKLTVLSLPEAERYKSNLKHVTVSITSPGSMSARLPRCASRRDTLRLEFWDIKIPFCVACKCHAQVCNDNSHKHWHIEPMTWEQARLIANFIRKWYTRSVEEFVFHCEAGISRSVGCACAVADWLGQYDRRFEHNAGNGHVRKLVLNALANGALTPDGASEE